MAGVCGQGSGSEGAGLCVWRAGLVGAAWGRSSGSEGVGLCIWEGGPACGGHTHLPENKLPIHVHGQVSKVQKHLVGGQLLLNDVIPVDGHDGHTDEKVEVIRLGG